jgi:hypothetical protein
MSNNPAYDQCIAAGGSPQMCAATFGPPEGGDDEAGKITNLSQLLNNQLFDLTRGGAPVRVRAIRLTGREGPGGYNLEDVETGQRYFAANRVLVDTLGYAYEVSPGGDVNTGNPIRSRMLSQSERNAAVSAGIPLLGVPSTGSTSQGFAPPAYSGTAAGIEHQARLEAAETARQRAWEVAETAKERTWQAEQDRIAAEAAKRDAELARLNQRRIALSGDLSALSQTAATVRQQYRSDLMGLAETMKLILGETMGKDVARGAIMSTGQVQQGVTPMQGFRTGARELSKSAGAQAAGLTPLPTPNLGADIAGLEAQMPQYQKWQQPPDLPQLPTRPAFMAEGGTMFGPQGALPASRQAIEGEVLAVDGVPVGTKGTSKVAVIVGEGRWDGDEEVVIQDRATGETEIIPLAGGAAQGANLPYDPSTMQQAMAPMYASLGLGSPVGTRRTSTGTTAFTGRGLGTHKELLGRMGISPRLVEASETGRVYYLEDGTRRPIGTKDFTKMGLQRQDVISMPWRQVAALAPEPGDWFTKMPAIQPGIERPYPGLPAPLIAPYSLENEQAGYAMPAMRTIAALWPDLSPAVQDVITSAFGVAGITPATMEAERRFFTPQGTAYAPGAARIA